MSVADRVVMHLHSTLTDVSVSQDTAREFLTRHSISDRRQFSVGIVLEELLTNIVRYGHGGDHGFVHSHDIGINVTLTLSEGSIELNIEDSGREFNPLEIAEPDLPHNLEEAKIGGLGIMLVRKAARRMHYERINNRNCLLVSLPL
jgi:anti-sigma regulatory factor (Ser/Thr protein kinase)